MTTQANPAVSALPAWVKPAGIALALIFALSWLYFAFNGVRDTGVKYEAQLTAQYLDNQNQLSAYISGFYEQLGVANLKSEKLDKILTDAVKGRYDKEGFGKGGALFNAIAEAYPDLTTLNIYDKIVDYIAGGREAYRAIQSKLLDMLRSYDTWREQGIVRSWVVATVMGMPSQRLVARVGGTSTRGRDALEQMYRIVLTSEAVQAYETGRMAPLQAK